MAAADRDAYVFAVVESPAPARVRIRGRSLRPVTVDPVAAIVTTVPPGDDFREPTPDLLREQHAVVEALAARLPAILPVRYGTVLGETALRALLAEHREKLREALELVRGRVQMTIRIFGDERPAPPSPDRSSGTAFLSSLRDRARRLPPEAETVRAAVARWTAAERAEPGQGGLLATLFHLVPRESVDSYRRDAQAISTTLAPRQVTVTGPWPPFAFVPELF